MEAENILPSTAEVLMPKQEQREVEVSLPPVSSHLVPVDAIATACEDGVTEGNSVPDTEYDRERRERQSDDVKKSKIEDEGSSVDGTSFVRQSVIVSPVSAKVLSSSASSKVISLPPVPSYLVSLNIPTNPFSSSPVPSKPVLLNPPFNLISPRPVVSKLVPHNSPSNSISAPPASASSITLPNSLNPISHRAPPDSVITSTPVTTSIPEGTPSDLVISSPPSSSVTTSIPEGAPSDSVIPLTTINASNTVSLPSAPLNPDSSAPVSSNSISLVSVPSYSRTSSPPLQINSVEESRCSDDIIIEDKKDADIRKLNEQLGCAQKRIVKLEAALSIAKSTNESQKEQLVEAEEIMLEQQKALKLADEGQSKLKSCLSQENQRRKMAEEGLKMLKDKVETAVDSDINVFIEELQNHFQDCCMDSRKMGAIGKELEDKFKEKLDSLSLFVKAKFDKLVEDRMTTRVELDEMKKTADKLNKTNDDNRNQKITVHVEKIKSCPPDEEVKKKSEIMEKMTKPRKRGRPSIMTEAAKKTVNVHNNSQGSKFKFQCEICKERFPYLSYVKRHKSSRHKISYVGEQLVGCAQCGQTFPNTSLLYNHRKAAHTSTAAGANAEDVLPPHEIIETPSLQESSKASNDDGLLTIEDENAPKPQKRKLSVTTHPPVPVFKMLSSVTKSFSPFSTQSAPLSPPNHNPSKQIPAKLSDGKFAKVRHGLNVEKRDKGYFCRCGKEFISRERLDYHLKSNKQGLMGTDSELSNSDRESTSEVVNNKGPTFKKKRTEDLKVVKHGMNLLNPLQCLCGYTALSNSVVKRHVLSQKSSPVGSDEPDLKKHSKGTHQLFLCRICKELFLNSSDLKIHNIKMHKSVIQPTTAAQKPKPVEDETKDDPLPSSASKRQSNKNEIRDNITNTCIKRKIHAVDTCKSNEGSFCTCGSQFVSKGLLNRHVWYYTIGRKFSCDLCPRRFFSAHVLKTHKTQRHKILSTEFASGCCDCGIQFNSRHEHSEHRKLVHRTRNINLKAKNEKYVPQKPLSSVVSCDDNNDDDFEEPVSPQPIPVPIAIPIYDGAADAVPLLGATAKTKRTSSSRAKKYTTSLIVDTSSHAIKTSTTKGGAQHQAKHSQDHHIKREKTPKGPPTPTHVEKKDNPKDKHSENNSTNQKESHFVNVKKCHLGFFCICGSQFPSEMLLNMHVRYFSLEKRFCCTHCSLRFNSVYLMKLHSKAVHKVVEKFTIGCRDCGIVYEKKSEFIKHRRRVHGMTIGTKKKSDAKPGKKLQVVLFHQREKRIVKAPKRYVEESAPLDAILDFNSDDDDNNESINNVDKKTMTTTNIKHQVDKSNVSNGHYCTCGKKFSYFRTLMTHVRYFTQNWKFQCHICKQRFFFLGFLKTHMKHKHQINSDCSSQSGNSVGCGDCGKKFANRLKFCEHRKIVHKKKAFQKD